MNADMTDEELSELAECIADACRGVTLRPLFDGPMGLRRRDHDDCCCPLGALLGARSPSPYPSPLLAADQLGLPQTVTFGIANGFDWSEPVTTPSHVDARAFALGRLFRVEAGQ